MMTKPSVRRCHKEKEFIARIQGSLGVNIGRVKCNIVDQGGMTEVMGRSGWGRNQTVGVVGFHVDENVYVLDSAPWTVLHELVHRSGVNADRLSRFVAEGLTEAIAVELKQSDDEHRATYPTETTWVQHKLLPALNMSAVQLGSIVAKAKDAPTALADLMVRAKPNLNRSELIRELQPQKKGVPSFNLTGRGHVTVAPVSDENESRAATVGALLLITGAALSLPFWVGRRNRGPAAI